MNKIKLIVGLGNPDKKYENTHHNVGLLFVKYLKTLKLSGYTLVASNAYMNESGKFIAKEIKKSGAKPEELLVVHDDSDLEIGKYKIQLGRGAAGHHGVENIQTVLKTKDFWRLRIGIRPRAGLPAEALPAGRQVRRAKAGEFVLKKISAADGKTLETTFGEIVKRLEKLL
ncbi:MAG: peptidyl-tRNA hydrolase [Candidatus Harrisonbacteria bacterium]|nr:peptidyl-tRNA hydrolase [Candidatus Harrisonbacteria bacterium]